MVMMSSGMFGEFYFGGAGWGVNEAATDAREGTKIFEGHDSRLIYF